MTPKEKAKKLVTEHFTIISDCWDIDTPPDKEALISSMLHPHYKSQAIQCALITINEILEFGNKAGIREPMMYWYEVKQEIKKLL